MSLCPGSGSSADYGAQSAGVALWLLVGVEFGWKWTLNTACYSSYFFAALQTSFSWLCESYRIWLVCDNNHRWRDHKLDSAICNWKTDVVCPCRSLVLGFREGQNREMLIVLLGCMGLLLMPWGVSVSGVKCVCWAQEGQCTFLCSCWSWQTPTDHFYFHTSKM